MRVSRPSTVTRPASRPPVKCGTSPLIAPSRVDLPAAGAAGHQAQLALLDLQPQVVQDRAARAPAYVTVTASKLIIPPPRRRPAPVRPRGTTAAGGGGDSQAGSTASRTPSVPRERQLRPAQRAQRRVEIGRVHRGWSRSGPRPRRARWPRPPTRPPATGPAGSGAPHPAAGGRQPDAGQHRGRAAASAAPGTAASSRRAPRTPRCRRRAGRRRPARRSPAGGTPRRCRPYPRESIAAASASERSSASTSTGIATPRSARNPRCRPPRSRRARRTRSTLSTSCGATDSATTTAVPTSYSAPGTAFSSRFGIGQRVRGAEADQHRGQPHPVVQPAEHLLGGDRPEEPDPGRPLRQLHRGQREQDHLAVPAAEDDPEEDPGDDDEEPGPQVVLERERPRRVAAPTGHDDSGDDDDQRQQQRVRGPAGRRGQPQRPEPPRPRMQGARKPGHPASLLCRPAPRGAPPGGPGGRR